MHRSISPGRTTAITRPPSRSGARPARAPGRGSASWRPIPPATSTPASAPAPPTPTACEPPTATSLPTGATRPPQQLDRSVSLSGASGKSWRLSSQRDRPNLAPRFIAGKVAYSCPQSRSGGGAKRQGPGPGAEKTGPDLPYGPLSGASGKFLRLSSQRDRPNLAQHFSWEGDVELSQVPEGRLKSGANLPDAPPSQCGEGWVTGAAGSRGTRDQAAPGSGPRNVWRAARVQPHDRSRPPLHAGSAGCQP